MSLPVACGGQRHPLDSASESSRGVEVPPAAAPSLNCVVSRTLAVGVRALPIARSERRGIGVPDSVATVDGQYVTAIPTVPGETGGRVGGPPAADRVRPGLGISAGVPRVACLPDAAGEHSSADRWLRAAAGCLDCQVRAAGGSWGLVSQRHRAASEQQGQHPPKAAIKFLVLMMLPSTRRCVIGHNE